MRQEIKNGTAKIIIATVAFLFLVFFVITTLSLKSIPPIELMRFAKLAFSLLLGIGSFWLLGTIKVEGTKLGFKISAIGGAGIFVVALFSLSGDAAKVSSLPNIDGLWTYYLINPYTNRPLYGVCEVSYSWDGAINIPNGQAWFAAGPPTSENVRGTWVAQHVSVVGKTAYVIYQMYRTTDDPSIEENLYQGLAQLTIRDKTHLDGIFVDFIGQRASWGSLFAQKASPQALSFEMAAEESYKRYRQQFRRDPTQESVIDSMSTRK